MIGRVLELLLQTTGYEARFLEGAEPEKLGDLLSDVQLVILPPLLGTECRQAYLEGIVATPAAAVPLMELVRDGEETEPRTGKIVPWPCSLEVLEREIKAAIPQCEAT